MDASESTAATTEPAAKKRKLAAGSGILSNSQPGFAEVLERLKEESGTGGVGESYCRAIYGVTLTKVPQLV